MIRFAADENFNGDVLRGLQRRVPDLDVVRVQDTEVVGIDDPGLLEWCLQERRVLLTHDIRTIPGFVRERFEGKEHIAGVVVVPGKLTVAVIIDQLTLIVECSLEGDWNNRIEYLPL